MKNKRIEKQLSNRKRYLKTAKHCWSRFDPKTGLFIYYVFDEEKKKSWWTDFGFVLGKTYVKVLFQHPRHIYYDHCDEISYDKANLEFPDRYSPSSIFKTATPNYKSVGKSRKKVVSYSTNFETPDEFYPRWKELREELLKTSDYEVKSSFNIELSDWARIVSVVYPVELESIESMNEFKEKIISWMTQKEPFVPEVCYTKKNWNEENE